MADESNITEATGEDETTLADEIIADLTAEITLTDETLFNAALLQSKVNAAIREVKRARNYPSYYTDEQIADDLDRFYSNIRSIALYDYNMVGAEGQSSSSENNTSRSYVDRNTYFSGVIPLAKF